jgi:hypothetical protein
MKLTFAVALASVALQPLTAFADWEIEPSHTNIGFRNVAISTGGGRRCRIGIPD